MSNELWRPTISVENLIKRAELLRVIREFFNQRNVLEVETPSLSIASVTDVNLSSFSTSFISNGDDKTLFLQTSPEYAMKRLIAAGSGSIYQITKAFRHEESGRYHNPEFTMLEWYRVGFNMKDLIDEVDKLLQLVLGCSAATRMSYQEAFMSFAGIDPLHTTVNELIQKSKDTNCYMTWLDKESKDNLLQYLFNMLVEPNIGQNVPAAIYHFPASQAALAKIDVDNPAVANRFEFYFKGIELANGFEELTDSIEQERRFDKDNKVRESNGLPTIEKDRLFLEALQSGLPSCSGVALGIDRLFMLSAQLNHIDEVIAFPVERC